MNWVISPAIRIFRVCCGRFDSPQPSGIARSSNSRERAKGWATLASKFPLLCALLFWSVAASSIRGADDSKSAVAPRPRSKVTAQQKMDLVVDDLNALKNKRKALAEVKDDLKRDLAALTAGPIKPKEATVGQLVNDLVPNWTDLHLLLGERQMFVRDLHVIFNSTLLSIDESERIIADVQLLLKGAGMGEAELQPLAGDLRLLVKELRPTPAQ